MFKFWTTFFVFSLIVRIHLLRSSGSEKTNLIFWSMANSLSLFLSFFHASPIYFFLSLFNSFIHSFFLSFFHSFFHSFFFFLFHSFFHSFIHDFSFFLYFVHSFILAFSLSFAHSFTHSFIFSFFAHSFIHSFIHSSAFIVYGMILFSTNTAVQIYYLGNGPPNRFGVSSWWIFNSFLNRRTDIIRDNL